MNKNLLISTLFFCVGLSAADFSKDLSSQSEDFQEKYCARWEARQEDLKILRELVAEEAAEEDEEEDSHAKWVVGPEDLKILRELAAEEAAKKAAEEDEEDYEEARKNA